MCFFFLPFMYTLKTRLNGLSKQFYAWLFTYLFPVSMLTTYVFMCELGSTLLAIFLCVSGLFMIYNAYEVGYIFNDAEVTKKESNPTLRLSSLDLSYYEHHKVEIYLLRLALLVFIFGVMFFFDVEIATLSLVVSVAILSVYVVYNRLRSRWNIPLYFILVYLRYFGLVSFFIDPLNCLLLVVIYPLLSVIEFSQKARFDIMMVQMLPRPDVFRLIYYIFVAPVVCGFYFYMGSVNVSVVGLSIYFCIYRVFSFFVSKLFR